MEFEYDTKNLLYVRIDRKRKFLATIFLRALGLKNDSEIIKAFYQSENSAQGPQAFLGSLAGLMGTRLSKNIEHPRTHETVVNAGRKITESVYKEIQKASITQVEVAGHDLEGAFAAADVVNPATGEVMLEANNELTSSALNSILESGLTDIQVFFPERDDTGVVISQTLKRDTLKTPQEALIEMYRKMRPGDPPTLDTATSLFNGMFFDPRKYDFSRVGRLKFNIKLGYYSKLKNRLDDKATEFEVLKTPGISPRPISTWSWTTRRCLSASGKGTSVPRSSAPAKARWPRTTPSTLPVQLPLDKRTLEPEDFYAAIRYLLTLKKNPGGNLCCG